MYNLFNSHSVGLFNCENTDKNRRGVRSYTAQFRTHHTDILSERRRVQESDESVQQQQKIDEEHINFNPKS